VQGELIWNLKYFLRQSGHNILKFFSTQHAFQSKELSTQEPSPNFFAAFPFVPLEL
jgi:hypothetical protein